MIKVVHEKKDVIAFFLLGVMLSTIFPITILPHAKSQTLSPFKQVEQGMHVLGVKCTGGMTLILKAETAMPFCVDASSVNTLVARGWAIMTSDFTTQSLSNPNRNFSKASYGPRDYHMVFLVSSASPQYENNLAVFAKYLQRGDSLLVEGYENSEPEIEQKIQKIKSMMLPGVNVQAIRIYNNINDLTSKVPNLPRGFSYIGYDYEQGTSFSPEFTPNVTRSMAYFDQARHAVSQYNVRTGEDASLIIMPPFGQLGKSQWNWGLAGKHTDIMSIQFQAFIKDSNFLNYVVDTIAKVKQESAPTKILVQVSLVPARGTPQDNLQAIILLHRLPIDSFLVFYHPNQTSDLEQFLSIVPDK
jgi:hypothetical protein